MGYTCQFCGKSSEEVPLYNDWPHDYLKMEGMACWECYHEQAIERGIAAFSLSDIGNNSGWMEHYTLQDAILTALDMTEDNIDQGIAIDVPIGGSYNASLIVRNGELYVRAANLVPLTMAKSDNVRHALLKAIIRELNWRVDPPMPKEAE